MNSGAENDVEMSCWEFLKMRNQIVMSRCAHLVLVVAFVFLTGVATADENWTRFRGPNGTGVGTARALPTKWAEDDYAWKVSLPGEGHAAPVIWKDKLFVTSATDEGQLRHLFCLNADSGEEIWCRSIAMNSNPKHNKNSFASSTPTTDGELVYVAFADNETFYLSAYDFAGELVWRRRLEGYGSTHGLGASPMLVDNLLIMAGDQEGPSWIRAFDKQTGETVWSVSRSIQRTSYTTPILIEPPGGDQQLIFLSRGAGLSSFDPLTGEQNWQTGELPARTIGSPIYSEGLLLATCGGGGRGKLLIAVDPTGANLQNPPAVVYSQHRELPYVPTMLTNGEYTYLWNDNGVAKCQETKTGNNIWTRRIGGNYSGSPVLINGKIYCIAEDGKVAVIDAAPQYRLYGKSPLGDSSHSTPSVAHGRLYLRGFHSLACLESTN
ncbi:outer membrane biogenesis protein BamB [Symmachiella macrocystis]|uniref:Outer membrane biogenesis protein BamB n=2 Tax=Symmachiella macrocystis TaxID=2527985 RepID=A0A5C6B510_9PLAN|nr:outer membrane biogenesis protein BamB [Symmachiella macrocystis]